MAIINNRIIEALRRQQLITEYIIYPFSDVENYQINLTSVPSYCKEDVLVIHKNKILPHWVESKGNVWTKIPKLIKNTPLKIYTLSGNPNAASASSVVDTFIREISGVVGAWDLNGDALDRSGHGHDGTVTGVTYSSGLFGENAGNFDGSDYIHIDAVTPTPAIGSFSIWAYSSNWATSTYRHLLDISNAGGDNRNMVRVQTNNTLFLLAGTDGNVLSSGLSGAGWKMITGTWQLNSLKLYIDKTLIGEDTSVTITTASTLATIGAAYNNTYIFTGLLAHVRHYNIVLSLTDVEAKFDNRDMVTTNYAGKELVRKYTVAEPIIKKVKTLNKSLLLKELFMR